LGAGSYVVELLDIGNSSIARDPEGRGLWTLTSPYERDLLASTGVGRGIRRGGAPDIGNSSHRPGSRGSLGSGPLTSPYERDCSL